MPIKEFLFSLLIFFCIRIYAVPGQTVWKRSNSPFIFDEKRTVTAEERIEIEAGVIMIFVENGFLEIRGDVFFSGSEQDSIWIANNTSHPSLQLNGEGNNSALFTNVSFTGSNGSFIRAEKFNIHINNSTITGGTANVGGAVYAEHSEIKIYNSTFSSNFAEQKGGVFYAVNSAIEIERTVFYNNSAGIFGGVLSLDRNSSARIFSSLFNKNTASYGGILSVEQSAALLVNGTCIYNTATYGGLFYMNGGSDLQVLNTIMWYNLAAVGNLVFTHDASNFVCDYSCYEASENNFIRRGNHKIALFDYHNIHTDPQFFLGKENQYSLRKNSPCIDAGSPQTDPLFYREPDLAGNDRIAGNRIDMGAFEWQQKETTEILKDYSLFRFTEADSTAAVQFFLAQPAEVVIQILDAHNREVFLHEKKMPAGKQTYEWGGVDSEGKKAQAGFYYFRVFSK